MSRRPRLLMLVNELESFFNHRMPIALAAKRHGWDVHVAMEAATQAQARDTAGLTFHHIPMDRSIAAPWRELAALRSLLNITREIKPDIIHAFTLKPIGLAGVAARRDSKLALAASVTGVGSFFLADDLKARIVRRLFVPVLRFALRCKPTAAIVQNVDDQQLVTQLLGLPADHCTLVPGSGINPETFKPTAKTSSGPVQVTLASRLLADKGVREFVSAARTIKSRGIDAIFVLAGGLDPANRSAIPQEEVDSWVKEGVVTWMGHVTDMPSLHASTHIACLPSYREGLPKSLLEAAACGLPIVTTNVPGCRDSIQDGVSGLLVPARDAAALTEALATLIADPDLRERFGKAGRKFVERDFSEAAITTQILGIYDDLLADLAAKDQKS